MCWWEPTLQHDLVSFCKKIKDMWFSVKLDTNWRDPKLLEELIEKKVVDFIAMDLKHSIYKLSKITGVNYDIISYIKSINIIKHLAPDYEFRTTVIKWVHEEKDIVSIVWLISGVKSYYLQNYRSWNTIEKNFKWQSFTESELIELKKAWEKYIQNVWIRM